MQTGGFNWRGGEGSVTDRVLEDMQDSSTHELRWSAYTRPSTGLVYMRARYYDPETGRFTQHDPAPYGMEVLWGQNNRWAYCANDPVNGTDPSGEFAWAVLGAVLTVVGTGLVLAGQFSDDRGTAIALSITGAVLGLAGTFLIAGPTFWAAFGQQAGAIAARVLPLVLRAMAVMVAGFLRVDPAMRHAATRINTISEFMCFLRRAWGG